MLTGLEGRANRSVAEASPHEMDAQMLVAAEYGVSPPTPGRKSGRAAGLCGVVLVSSRRCSFYAPQGAPNWGGPPIPMQEGHVLKPSIQAHPIDPQQHSN
jgi:hypothetical protein